MNREEFDNLLSQGLSVEQIVSFEDGKNPKIYQRQNNLLRNNPLYLLNQVG